jgi:hypothetical protein
MPTFAAQFLESYDPAQHTAQTVRAHLQEAFARLPLDILIIGWDLPVEIIEACANESSRHNALLYRWQPLLSGDGTFIPRPEWQTIGATGETIQGFKGMPEFTFVCPNRPAVQAALEAHLQDVLREGFYRGIFLDRIRFPSPASDPLRELACFCPDCQHAAADEGLDLESVRTQVQRLSGTPQGRRELVRQLFQANHGSALEGFFTFRLHSTARAIRSAADILRAHHLAIGLDTFSPVLTRMVGQDLSALDTTCDWIKPMTYAHTLGPAGVPHELLGLVNWLIAAGTPEAEALELLSTLSGFELPPSRSALQMNGIPAAAVKHEMERGKQAGIRTLLGGIALVEMENVNHIPTGQLNDELSAYRQGGADGLVLSWDLWHIPLETLNHIANEWNS